MSQRSLLLATKTYLQQKLIWNGQLLSDSQIDIMLDGRPPAEAGDIFVAIHPGSFRNKASEHIEAVHSLNITISRRVTTAAFDRFGAEFLINEEVDAVDELSQQIIEIMHLNYELMQLANSYITSNLNAWVEPLRFENCQLPRIIGAEWFHGDGSIREEGIIQQLTFNNAVRAQWGRYTISDDSALLAEFQQNLLPQTQNQNSPASQENFVAGGNFANLNLANTFSLPQSLPVYDTGGQVYNVKAAPYGAVGNGVHDDTAAIANAIAAAKAAGGGTVFFPIGTYLFSTTINLNLTEFITLQGATNSNVSGAGSKVNLVYTAAGSESAISMQSADGCTLKNITVQWSNSGFTGYLIDCRQITGQANTADIVFEDCTFSYISAHVQGSPPALLILDGCFAIDINRCRFLGGNYNIIGRLTSSGFNNTVRCCQCNFEFATTCAILNPHQNWKIISCIFEPLLLDPVLLTVGAAGAITHSPGVPMYNVSFDSCWWGDESISVTGSWITWYGYGLSVTGNHIGVNRSTTFLTIDTAGCIGINFQANYFAGNGGNSTLINFGTFATTGFTYLSNAAVGVTNNFLGTLPPDYIYDTAGTINISNPVVTGNITATTVNATGNLTGLTSQLGSVSPNLLTTGQADFEGTVVSGWASNNHAGLALSTAASNHGAKSLACTPLAGVTNQMAIGMLVGTAPFYSLIPVQPNTLYSALASFLCAPGSPPRQIQLDIYWFTSAGYTGGQLNRLASSGNVNRDNTSSWFQLTVSGTTPSNCAYLGLFVTWADTPNLSTSETHYLDTCQLAQGNVTVWSLPGAATLTMSNTNIQPSVGQDLSIGANGAGSVLHVNPPGGGTGGTYLGDGNISLLKFVNGHFLIGGFPPTFTAGSGAGTSPTVTINGSDINGTITLITGSSPVANATVLTVTFNTAFTAKPTSITFTPVSLTAQASGVIEDYASRLTTSFSIIIGSTPLTGTTTYIWNYQVFG